MNLSSLFSARASRALKASASLAALAAWLVLPLSFAMAAEPDPASQVQNLEQAHLPVAAVTVHQAANPVGTVYFIPQEHENPGTGASDPANDNAVVAQQQIAQIVSYLTNQTEVPFVMMEGYTYGAVPDDRVALTKSEMQASQEFTKALPELERACQSAPTASCRNIVSGAQSMASEVGRAAVLQGGALDDKAAGASFTLYGGEDQSLLDQGATIVRDNVYLTDRLSQLQQPSGQSTMAGPLQAPASGSAQTSPSSGLLQLLALLMGGQKSQGVAQSDLTALENSGNAALSQAAQDIGTAVDDFNAALTQKQNMDTAHAQNLPSRQDNPYSDITNPAQIQQLLQKNESQIQSTIVDARNSAAADNFAKGLADTHSQDGVIIFGAGHSEGLIQDLNQKGLNVVAIVPQELGTDQETLTAVGAQQAAQSPQAPNSLLSLLQMLQGGASANQMGMQPSGMPQMGPSQMGVYPQPMGGYPQMNMPMNPMINSQMYPERPMMHLPMHPSTGYGIRHNPMMPY